MRKLLQHLPNAITLLAMCLGLTALNLSYVRDDVYWSLILLLIAFILDGVDGRLARRLKVDSPLGAQLDSLADFLNFCVAPALIMYEWCFKDLYFWGWATTLVYLLAGGYRLARFNVMYSEGAENVVSNFFIGMPSPAGALMVFAPIILTLQGYIGTEHVFYKCLYVVVIAFMMMSTVRTPSLKAFNLPKSAQIYVTTLAIAFVTTALWRPVETYIAMLIVYGSSIVACNLHFAYKRHRRKAKG